MGRIYAQLMRPALFALPAEAAHRVALAALGLPAPWGLIGGAAPTPSLDFEIAGLRFANPVGLAAGFDKDCRRLAALGRLGFGYLVGGTVTLEARRGNDRPRIGRYVAQRSLVNAMGFPNRGAQAAHAVLRDTRGKTATLVSIAGSSVSEVIRTSELVAPFADGIEFNVSCPNVRWGRSVDTEAMLSETLPKLKRTVGKPIFVKLPPYRVGKEREAVISLVRIAVECGADAITASNAFPVTSRRMALGTGGLSGKAVFADTLRIVADIYRATHGRVPVNACGGIFDGDDALACIKAGASTVQVYSGFAYQGPRVVREITARLVEATATSNRRLNDIIGISA